MSRDAYLGDKNHTERQGSDYLCFLIFLKCQDNGYFCEEGGDCDLDGTHGDTIGVLTTFYI